MQLTTSGHKEDSRDATLAGAAQLKLGELRPANSP